MYVQKALANSWWDEQLLDCHRLAPFAARTKSRPGRRPNPRSGTHTELIALAERSPAYDLQFAERRHLGAGRTGKVNDASNYMSQTTPAQTKKIDASR